MKQFFQLWVRRIIDINFFKNKYARKLRKINCNVETAYTLNPLNTNDILSLSLPWQTMERNSLQRMTLLSSLQIMFSKGLLDQFIGELFLAIKKILLLHKHITICGNILFIQEILLKNDPSVLRLNNITRINFFYKLLPLI